MRLSAGAAALSLVCLSACPILSLKDLENDNPSSCGAMMKCIAGWHCGADGHCHEDVAGACNDGDTMSCGMSGGACHTGTATCASGHFGACMGAVDPEPERCDGVDNDCNGSTDEGITDGGLCTEQRGVCAGSRASCVAGALQTACDRTSFGSLYETVEASCDGKDNDCNGMTDEGLIRDCPLDAGVCAGAKVACLGGVFAQCSTALYTMHNAAYEAFETKCDGLDNDCDGLVDAWSPQNVSGSPGHVSRKPVAVTVSGTGDALVLWEEEQTAGVFSVRARVVHRDGTMTPIVAPATTVTNAASSGGPAVAGDGNGVVAVWMETVLLPDAGVLHRVQMATLDPTTGRSTLMNEAALQLPGFVATDELAIAVDSGGGRVMVAGVAGGNLSITAYPTNLQGAALFQKNNLQTGIKNVQASAAAGKGFWLSGETPASGVIQRCAVSSVGDVLCAALTPTGTSPLLLPLSSTPLIAQSYFVRTGGIGQTIAAGSCDGGGCSAVTDLPVSRQDLAHLRAAALSSAAPADLFAWDEGGLDYHFFLRSRPDAGALPAGANPGRRPTPLYIGDAIHGGVVFDTEGVSGQVLIQSDDVYLARYCL